MEIIKDGQICEDRWTHVADDAPLPETPAIVSLARFVAERDGLAGRFDRLGVELPADVDLLEVAPLLRELALVAVHFPRYTDGRGYSTGRLLRERHGFRGELRATGDVMRDQLFYMRRCGFDAFELKAGKDLKSALEGFGDFTVTYQAAADDPRPLFRRRA